jgi:hypothetical protein
MPKILVAIIGAALLAAIVTALPELVREVEASAPVLSVKG